MMERVQLEQLISKIHDIKIVVYGDFCIDAYWIMDPRGGELSVETSIKAEAVANHYYTLGGAANIAANLAALTPAEIYAVGLVGDDIYGRELLRQLESKGVDTQFMIVQEKNFDTYAFGKRYIGDVEQPRIDYGFYNERSHDTDQKLIDNLQQALNVTDALICNQQVDGSMSEGFIESANRLFSESRKVVVLDSRHYAEQFTNVYQKINYAQAVKMMGTKDEQSLLNHEQCFELVSDLYQQSGKPVLLTRGNLGMLVADGKRVHTINGLRIGKKTDPVGAGDTVVSAYVLALACGENAVQAARFANLAAGVTVQKRFRTGTASFQEILKMHDQAVYIYNPDLAFDVDQARYLQDTEIEICAPRESLGFGRIQAIIFDHDGSVSTLRENADDILGQMMVQCILGEDNGHASLALVQEGVKQNLALTQGLDPLGQMHNLVEMIKSYGLVPSEQILDAMSYLKIYNKAVMEPVRKNLIKIEKGEFEPCDFIIKGAESFIEGLQDRGVKLFLIGNAELVDIEKESELLEYNQAFNGGIYGALGNGETVSKSLLIEKLIVEHNLHSPEFAVISSGTLEIQTGRKYDGLAIGMAANQVRRYGLDLARRERLVKAGAHLVLPDYSQWEMLLDILVA